MNDVVNSLKQYLVDKYEPDDIWCDAGSAMDFMIVFKLASHLQHDNHGKIRPQRLLRADSFVDIAIDDGSIIACSHRRNSITLDFRDPTSIDKLDEFIVKYCINNRRNGKRQVVYREEGAGQPSF